MYNEKAAIKRMEKGVKSKRWKELVEWADDLKKMRENYQDQMKQLMEEIRKTKREA